MLVSSAKSKHSGSLVVLGRSLIYNMKNKGLNMEPCETLHLIICSEKWVSLLLEKELLIHCNASQTP